MKIGKYHIKAATFSLFTVIVIVYFLQTLFQWRNEQERFQKLIPLLKADLERTKTTENPVVVAFQVVNQFYI
jgi:hypothetical protein